MDFLAIDPGSYKTGVAYFRDAELVNYWLLEVKKGVEIEERIPALIYALDALVYAHGEIRAIACERLSTLRDRPPPPELATYIRRLKRWAMRTHKFVWHEYHPSSVVASVRARDMRGKNTKEIMRLGVQFLYGPQFGAEFGLDQNVIDAIAVGHCHISKTHVASVLGVE